VTMLTAGVKEFNLTKYLVSQLMLSHKDRMNDLRIFLPNARDEDWEVVIAGQRVQVIKDTEDSKGNLQFGTEVITSDDGSLAALLGASPGASTVTMLTAGVKEFNLTKYLVSQLMLSHKDRMNDLR
ncbi:malate:quinone oxidoreductase, partial [Corynebacterium diphtheriae]